MEEETADIARDTATYRIEERLRIMWMYLGKIGQEVVHDEPARATADFGQFSETLDRLDHVGDFVERQVAVFKYIRATIFMIGSVLVLIGRYLELHWRLE